MEFGLLSTDELEKVRFRLPRDPVGNAAVLAKGRSNKTRVYLGCAKWGRKEWVGKIYPPHAKEKDFLQYYARHYGSIELNATNYKLYDGTHIAEWKDKVHNPNFIFCPKAHRAMSFFKDSPAKHGVTNDFISSVRHFGKQLGPIFITHNEKLKWTAEGEKALFEYLANLPTDLTFFLEERAADFFASTKTKHRYYDRLKELGIGAVITDTAGRQDVLHMQLTIPKAFIRFVGNSLHPSDFPRIDHWATRLKKWIDGGIEEIYFFMHMHDEGLSPELTQYVIQQFNKICQLDLPRIEFL